MESEGSGQFGTGEDVEKWDFKGANTGAGAGRHGEVTGTGADDEVLAQRLNGDGTELAIVVLDGGGVGGFVVGGQVVVELIERLFDAAAGAEVDPSGTGGEVDQGTLDVLHAVELETGHVLGSVRHATLADGGGGLSAAEGLLSSDHGGAWILVGHGHG